jgi:lipopolysaccharide transport system ATP-binding protein
MSPPVILCRGIGKRYRIGPRPRYRALRDSLADAARAPFDRLRRAFRAGGPADPCGPDSLWALKDIDFEVQQGEVLGIIGRNGAGKSTLLRVLARITAPSEGQAEIRGRVGALLEVGTGFHPELTGRENVYLNGAILGMAKRDIDRRFDEIVDFSECGRFLDLPVKHFSSGMYMRLAFAVAAHLETEILLVDEVLAVGDAPFQKKCLGRITDAARQGRTVLFISHNLLAVEGLCSRALCLEQGRIVAEGPPRTVASSYLREWNPASTEVVYPSAQDAPGNPSVRLHRACVRPVGGRPTDGITIRTPFVVEIEYWKMSAQDSLELGVNVFNEHGTLLFSTWWPSDRPVPSGLVRSWFVVPADLLNTGMHRIELGVEVAGGVAALHRDDLLVFNVLDAGERRGLYHGAWPGAVRPDLQWITESIEAPCPVPTGAPPHP